MCGLGKAVQDLLPGIGFGNHRLTDGVELAREDGHPVEDTGILGLLQDLEKQNHTK